MIVRLKSLRRISSHFFFHASSSSTNRVCALRSIIRATSLLLLACLGLGVILAAQVTVSTGGTSSGLQITNNTDPSSHRIFFTKQTGRSRSSNLQETYDQSLPI